jgi:short subunit dehydrogenase-like uncharacterized protein
MIGVIGATGFTGTLIVERLAASGRPVRLLARNEEKMATLMQRFDLKAESAVFDVLKPSTYSAIAGCNVIINCAGPFSDLGEPVVRSVINYGAHYIDTTGEQSFIRMVYEQYGWLAKEKKLALVPACAFEYAFGETAAALVLRKLNDCRQLDIIYRMKNAHTSIGTRKSILRALESACFQRVDARPVNVQLGAVRLELSGSQTICAVTFPGGEVFMVPLHSNVPNLGTYMESAIPCSVLNFMMPVIVNTLRLKFLHKTLGRMTEAAMVPTAEQRMSTTFEILCRARDNTGRVESVSVKGTDPYGLTAHLASNIAGILESGAPAYGALAPSMVAGPNHIVDITKDQGVEWNVPEVFGQWVQTNV